MVQPNNKLNKKNIMPRGKRQSVTMVETPDKKQSDIWDFPVYQEELLTSKGVKSGIHAVVRGDNNRVVGQYRGVKALGYPDLVQTFENALDSNGFKFTNRNLFTTHNGSRFYGRYDLDTLNAGGDSFRSALRLQSSHDGSLTPGFSFEADRLACLNAMMVMAQVFAMFRKHSESLNLDFIGENIQTAIQAGQDHMTQLVDRMTSISLNYENARNVISNITRMGAKAGVSERTGYFTHHNWANPTADERGLGDNLYRLYNAATRYTRDVNKVGRFEMSRKANLYVTGAFDLAARRKFDLDTLLETPQKPLDFDSVVVNN